MWDEWGGEGLEVKDERVKCENGGGRGGDGWA